MTSRRSDGAPTEPLVLFTILQTGRIAERAFTDAFGSVGLPAGQFGILATVNDEPGITQAEVARRLDARPQSISRNVTALLEDSLIQVDEPTRRGSPMSLRITTSGKARLDAAWPAVESLNRGDALGITQEEVVITVRILDRIRERLHASPPHPSGSSGD